VARKNKRRQNLKQSNGEVRNITLFLSGQAISILGSLLVNYAIVWTVTLQTKSSAVMTLLTISNTVPMFLISPFAGVWADRYNKKYLINIADGFVAMFSLVVAAAFTLGRGKEVPLLLVCSVARGFCQGIQNPSVSAFIPELVSKEKLLRVNGINSTVLSVSMLAAPVLSGFLLTFVKIEHILYIDAVTAVISILLLTFGVKNPRVAVGDTPEPQKRNLFRETKDGINYIKRSGMIKNFILVNIGFNLLIGPCAMLTPLQVVRDFGTEPWRLAVLELTFCAGFFAGGVLISVWGGFKDKIRTIWVAALIMSVCTVFLGITPHFAAYLAAMFIIGIGVPFFNTPMVTLIQERVSPDFTGRVFSVITASQTIAMPLGMLVWGPLGDMFPIDFLMIASGVGLLSVAFFVLRTPADR
jgi:DHA3 family macrolide efflux protein-like MFS transporter